MSPLTHEYRTSRQNAPFSLAGTGAHDVLAQVCNVVFEELDLSTSPVVMTLVIGVALPILPDEIEGRRRYRIRCDPSLGANLYDELKSLCEQPLGTLA